MSKDIFSLLNQLDLKELSELAKLRRINIPENWSKSLIVELLASNVSKYDIQNISTRSFKARITPEKDSVIIIKDLVKKFGNIIAVDGLNLEIREGELFSLLGPNGAGKTTTINILTGIVKPTSGKVVVGGYDVQMNLGKIKALIGVCPQKAAVFQFLNAQENIKLFGHLYSVPPKELEERTNLLLDLLELADVSSRKARGYSGGMLRKLNLIIALISDPRIVFLDEPTVGMDARARRATWQFIGSLKNQNKTVILTTHYIEEAEALSDRVGIIDYGKLIALGSPRELKEIHEADNLEEVFLKIAGRRITEGL
jgi:ABC-2 type transport system ATP-binding protein